MKDLTKKSNVLAFPINAKALPIAHYASYWELNRGERLSVGAWTKAGWGSCDRQIIDAVFVRYLSPKERAFSPDSGDQWVVTDNMLVDCIVLLRTKEDEVIKDTLVRTLSLKWTIFGGADRWEHERVAHIDI